MISASRRHAENRFAMIEKRQQKALSEQDQKRKEMDENTLRLKALRMAKEEAERLASEVKRGTSAKLVKTRLKANLAQSSTAAEHSDLL